MTPIVRLLTKQIQLLIAGLLVSLLDGELELDGG